MKAHRFHRSTSLAAVVCILIWIFDQPVPLRAQSLIEKRCYEPVVVRGDDLSSFFGVPVDELRLYAYRADTGSWQLMPFQIDERSYGEDPNNPPVQRWFYFVPEEWESPVHDGVLGDHDELVFMIRDMGDRASDTAWIDNGESKENHRLELEVFDPLDPETKAYAYGFRSSSFNQVIPKPYGFYCDTDKDSVATDAYAVGMGPYGLIEDIVIHPPYGSGIDFFDTQKLRFSGIIDLFLPIDLQLTETNIFMYDDLRFNMDPVVRLIRQARQTIRIGSFISHGTSFYITTHFFPFSGRIRSGASIASEDLKIQYPYADISIVLRSMRQSWDFLPNATGMRFSNRYNRDLLIDGSPDMPDPSIDLPPKEWSFITGMHGSVLFMMQMEEIDWDRIELYYHDNGGGGQADSVEFGRNDTGDDRSYGDHGLLFTSNGKDSLNLNLDFFAYFIPETNLSADRGEMLAETVLYPASVRSESLSSVEASDPIPEDGEFYLFPNYPNPFNSRTNIVFDVPYRSRIHLEILDSRGRPIRTLKQGLVRAGRYTIPWDGKDEQGHPMPSGQYVSKLSSPFFTQIQKVMLVQ